MAAFNGQHCLPPPITLGQAQGTLDEVRASTQSRTRFGRRVADFQGQRWMLADMAIALDVATDVPRRVQCRG